jgi:acetyl-CoA C-acetyltransferase
MTLKNEKYGHVGHPGQIILINLETIEINAESAGTQITIQDRRDQLTERVAIVGVSQEKFESSKSDIDHGELAFEVIDKLLQKTGVKYKTQTGEGLGIDRILTTIEDLWAGQTDPHIWWHKYMGGFLTSQSNVAADGTMAVYHGVLDILSGHYEMVLVLGVLKESECIRDEICERGVFDPIYLRPLGLDYLSASALQARQYMNKYGATEEQFAKVAVRNRKNARNNPFAQEPLDLTTDDVLKSEVLASPIKVLDARPPVSDGACALLLTSEKNARKITDHPVYITGLGNCYDAHYLGDRDLAESDSLRLASERAYKMAGITNPLKQIDVAEIVEEYSYQELMWMEGLHFCESGQGGRLVDEGIIEMNGQLPVNPSGGVLAGNPMQVAGTARCVEAALQLRGEAGKRQVDGAKTALVHGTYGPCGQSHCVLIFSK